MPPPPKVSIAADARAVLESSDALPLARGLGALARTTKVTLDTLKQIGYGTASGVLLVECSTAKEKADCRKEVATVIVSNDSARLAKLMNPSAAGGRAATAELVQLAALRLHAIATAKEVAGEKEGGRDVQVFVHKDEDKDGARAVPLERGRRQHCLRLPCVACLRCCRQRSMTSSTRPS